MLLYIKKVGGFVNEQNVEILVVSLMILQKKLKQRKRHLLKRVVKRNQPMLLVIRLFLINKLSILLQMLNGLMNGMILMKQIPKKY